MEPAARSRANQTGRVRRSPRQTGGSSRSHEPAAHAHERARAGLSQADAIRSGPARTYRRYVAIGDSSTEGLDDPDGRGGYRGWANRLAERIAELQGSLLYANLGVRGRLTREIRHEQLTPALAMDPDLVTVFSGTNDVVARRFEVDALARDVMAIHRSLIAAGVTVITFTLPDLTPVMPLARLVARRVEQLNTALRRISAETGAILVDIAAHPVASDPRLWSDDRLHANSEGHARIAAALAHGLGLPGSSSSWTDPLPTIDPPSAVQRLWAETRWSRDHFVPWIWRGLTGRWDPLESTCRHASLSIL